VFQKWSKIPSLNEVVKNLLPNKTLQHVKQCLRREARKPVDVGVKQHIMHVCRINTKEIARCPPAFNNPQCLTPNEIIDILLFGAPKSWQREMDRQGFDPPAKTVTEAPESMERIKMSEDFNGDRKVAAMTKKGNNKTKAHDKGSSGADGSKHCMLHGNNNAHDTSECKTLMTQAEKLTERQQWHQQERQRQQQVLEEQSQGRDQRLEERVGHFDQEGNQSNQTRRTQCH